MILTELDLDLALRHIRLFIEDRDDLGDVLAQEELDQGFSWRPTMLTFFIFEECDVTAHVKAEFRLEDRAVPSPEAERVIKVPFVLGTSDRLTLSYVRDSWTAYVDLPAGDYCVTFELGHADKEAPPDCCELWARYTFVPGTCEAEILRADPDLKPPPKLVMGKA